MRTHSRSKLLGFTGAFIIVTVVLTACLAQFLVPYPPDAQDLSRALLPPAWMEGGSQQHLLGTDQLGRDILSRILVGSQISVFISLAGTVVALLTGMLLGAVSGYFGGWVDAAFMRFVDIVMAIPFILLIIFIAAIVGPGVLNIILIAGVSSGVGLARLIRGEVLALRKLEYIQASKSLGAGHTRVIIKHILPNVMNVLIVIGMMECGQFILVESSLSFLGLGVPADIPTWGKMLAESQTYIFSNPLLAIFPGAAITMTVLGIHLFGDWLRDWLDPKTGEHYTTKFKWTFKFKGIKDVRSI